MLTQVHNSVTHQNQLAHHVHDVVEALGIDANGGFTPTVTSRIFASWLRRSSRCGRFSWRWLALGGGRRRLSTLSGCAGIGLRLSAWLSAWLSVRCFAFAVQLIQQSLKLVFGNTVVRRGFVA